MRRIMGSPLIPTMFAINGIVLLALGLVYIVPLPDPDSRQNARTVNDELIDGLRSSSVDTSIILERPIFHQNRRPAITVTKAAAPVAVETKPEAPFKLVGVVGSSESNRTAYLQNINSNETVVAKVGEVIEAWRVDTIGTNFITLVYGDERQVIELAGGG